MKRDVPGYIEKAFIRVRDKRTYIETLCELFPDTMRWVSYYIDVCLDRKGRETIAEIEAKEREQSKARRQSGKGQAL